MDGSSRPAGACSASLRALHPFGRRSRGPTTLSAASTSRGCITGGTLAAEPSRHHSSGEVRVGIVMGSDSDLPIMLEAVKVLDALEIGSEVIVASAHRTP